MKTALLAIFGLALTSAFVPARAAQNIDIRCGQKLAKIGDTRGKVRDACGKPDDVRSLRNGFNAPVGERWYYYRTGYNASTITFTFSGDRVVATSKELE